MVGYDFDGYWEDIGTIRSFYDTNLALTNAEPQFNFYDPQRPIYSHSRFLPGSLIENSHLERVLLSDGCCIQNAEIIHSVVGLRSQIRDGVKIADSILMGMDYYESFGGEEPEDDMIEPPPLPGGTSIPMGIGENSRISGAIIDKNARIGRDVVIEPFPRGVDLDGDHWVVRDGIVVIPKDAFILPGTHIGPQQA